ncbi:MAG TPA: ABC transporter permease [Phycisphaerales bacterium]|nr:ABC transporter permease [Phycisphaerales bacterium]
MLRLAVRMLLGEPARWMGVVLGVFFCTFLITHLLSMFSGMMERSYALVTDIPEADIWVMDPAVENVDEPFGLPATAMERVRGVEGVSWALPLYTGSLRARMTSGALRPVLIIGVDDATLVGAPRHMLEGSLADLRLGDGVVVDEASAKNLLRVPLYPQTRLPGWQAPQLTGPTRALGVGDEMLVNDRRLKVVGIAKLTPRFMSRPVVYTTYSRAVDISPRQRNLLSFILVRVADGRDPVAVAREIDSRTGLRARTHGEFTADTYWYYVRTTGVVARMGLMVSIGVAVGVSVSSLLLYLFTIDNERYYATFKALGATNAMIAGMIAVQAMVCGACGYGIGVGVSSAVGTFVVTDAMPYVLTVWTLLFTLGAVLVVCVVSAVLSALRVFRLDPASVFNK